MIAFFPDMAFANFIGPVERKFAWLPVKLWNGSFAWLRPVARRCAVVHGYLTPGGGDTFWVYSTTNAKETSDG
jgi:hypothetical protein